MALPDTLTGVAFPAQNYYGGPFKSSGGSFYFVSPGTGPAADNVNVEKSTNPGTSAWTTVGNQQITTTGAIVSLTVFPVGDVLHIAIQSDSDEARYAAFNMGTDSFDNTGTDVELVADAITLNACDIVVQGDGDISIVFQGDFHKDMGTSYESVFENRSTDGGTSFGTSQEVDDVSAEDFKAPRNVLGDSDTTHVLWAGNTTNRDIYQRAISSAGTLQTIRDTAINYGDATVSWPLANGVTVDRAGTTKLRVGAAVGKQPTMLTFDAAADPSSFSSDTIDADLVPATYPMSVAADGSTIHALWTHNADSDLYHSDDGDADSWATETKIVTGTINAISCNVYDNGGQVLAYVYDDGGAIKYDEIDIAVSGDQTVIASAVSAALTAVTPVLNIKRLADPVSAALTVQAPTINVAQTALIASSVFSVTTPSLPLRVSPTAIASSFSVITPVLNINRLAAPVAANFSIVTPTLDRTVNTDPVSASFSVVTPNVFIAVTVVAAPIASAFSVIMPVLNIKRLAASVAANFSVTMPILNITRLAAPVAANFSIATPTVFNAQTVIPIPIPVNFSIVTPALGIVRLVVPVTSTFSVITPVLNVTRLAAPVAANFSMPAPAVTGALIVTATAVAASFSIVTPSLTVKVIPSIVSAAFAIPTPTVSIVGGPAIPGSYITPLERRRR